MHSDETVLSTLGELAALPLRKASVGETAEAVVAMAMATVECDFAGLTVLGAHGQLASMATTAAVVDQADALQYELKEGPCVAAFWEQDTFVANELRTDPRWPLWGPKAAALGFGALMATRLANGEQLLGALNLYSSRERVFSDDDVYLARLFAVQATSALLAVRNVEELCVAIDNRTQIGQAQGILMERFDIDADQAFAVLRRYSQDRNVKLREVARDVVVRRALPELDM